MVLGGGGRFLMSEVALYDTMVGTCLFRCIAHTVDCRIKFRAVVLSYARPGGQNSQKSTPIRVCVNFWRNQVAETFNVSLGGFW